MQVRELKDDTGYDDWSSAFDAAGLRDADLDAEVIYDSEEFPEGYGSATMGLVFKRADGTVAALYAWCDTTGWDCQAGGEIREFGSDANAARAWLDNPNR